MLSEFSTHQRKEGGPNIRQLINISLCCSFIAYPRRLYISWPRSLCLVFVRHLRITFPPTHQTFLVMRPFCRNISLYLYLICTRGQVGQHVRLKDCSTDWWTDMSSCRLAFALLKAPKATFFSSHFITAFYFVFAIPCFFQSLSCFHNFERAILILIFLLFFIYSC